MLLHSSKITTGIVAEFELFQLLGSPSANSYNAEEDCKTPEKKNNNFRAKCSDNRSEIPLFLFFIRWNIIFGEIQIKATKYLFERRVVDYFPTKLRHILNQYSTFLTVCRSADILFILKT